MELLTIIVFVIIAGAWNQIKKYPVRRLEYNILEQKRWEEGRFAVTEGFFKRLDMPSQVVIRKIKLSPEDVKRFVKAEHPINLIAKIKSMDLPEAEEEDILNYKKGVSIVCEMRDLVDKPLWAKIKSLFNDKQEVIS